jgi:hypothetical protein
VPTADDLDDPAAFVARSDTSDPIAELEKLANDEKAAEDQAVEDQAAEDKAAEDKKDDGQE